MKLQKILLLTCILLGFSQLSFSSNVDQSNEMGGIEPITENVDHSTAIDLKTAKIAKQEKSGFGKIFSWVKKKSMRAVHKVAQVVGIFDSNDEEKEMWITLALWFFLGGFAAHRWYKGKPTGWNILFILTLGGCGIWALVDLINILTGKF